MADPRIAPAPVRAALRRGIDLYNAGRGGKGLVDATVDWARALASGAKISYPKAVKMRGWFARHGPPEKESARRLRDSQSPAAVSWLLWGGDPAIPYRERGWDDPVNAWVRGAIAFYEDNPTVDPGSIEPPRVSRRNGTPWSSGRYVRIADRFPHIAANVATFIRDRSTFNYHGFRIVDDPSEAVVGRELGPSRVWDDGTPTDTYLPGTSALGVRDLASAQRALQLADGYLGRYLLLLGADGVADGPCDDPGEVLLRYPRVLAAVDLGGRSVPVKPCRAPARRGRANGTASHRLPVRGGGR